MRSLFASLLKSCSKDRAGAPLIRSAVMFGQFLSVVFPHVFLVVSHASSCPLFSHSSHMCCSLSSTLMFVFLHSEHIALSAHPGILSQKVPHFILPISRHLRWSLRRGGTPRALTPLRSFPFLGRSPVVASTSAFASSKGSWWRIGVTPLVCHCSNALYMCLALRAWSLAPSWRAGWLLIHSSSPGAAIWSPSLPSSARASAFMLP